MWIFNDTNMFKCTNNFSAFINKPIIKNNYIENWENNYICVISDKLFPNLKPGEMIEVDIVTKGDISILNNYTDEQLKEELHKRFLIRKEEKEKVLRCRHCKHFSYGNRNPANQSGWCMKQEITNKKGITRYRIINKSNKVCELYEKKEIK